MSSLLIKHDIRSQRVKGVCFHPKRPWVLIGLHSGLVQLIDYRTGNTVDRFEEHDGPVRGVDFHVVQPMFATGGDDCKIKIWNYKLRRCICNLIGHLDYVRTVQFHKDQPWLVSASDDQTLIIWNWQSRNRLCVLSGHNHYVMSGQFHPTQDLVVSASLDLTARVWDISGLRFKKQETTGNHFSNDLFGSTSEATTKALLEGHEKGVNWASFHPTRPFIVTAADDRTIRIWRLEDNRAFEIEHLRGHTSNVSCVMYCNEENMIVSNSEDRTIRVWDGASRSQCQIYRRDHDRFWVLNVHPTQNLIAAGHDTGLVVFKLERERPAMCLANNNKLLYFIKDRVLHRYDFDKNSTVQLMKLRRHPTPARSLSCNTADNSAVVSYDTDGGLFELLTVPTVPTMNMDPDARKGAFKSAVFFGANKFATLDQTRQIVIRLTNSEVVKPLPAVGNTDRLFPGPQGFIICRSDDNIALFDVAQKVVVAEIGVPHVKYVVWDTAFNRAALLAKHYITVVTRRMKQVAVIHETSRIKSAVFDDKLGVLIYTTQSHLKFCALQTGETGTLRTLESCIYLVRVSEDVLWYVDRNGQVVRQQFDNTELNFKLALQQERYRDVLKLIQSQKVHGQALVAYLHKNGHADIAMHFASDPTTKFNLAIECGMMDVAKQAAIDLNNTECWRKLAAAAIKTGDIALAQLANAKIKNFTGLGIQCAITGNLGTVKEVLNRSNDDNVKIQLSLFNGDALTRVRVLEKAGQLPLAYCTARSNGLEDVAAEILAKMDPVVAQRVQRTTIEPSPQVDPEQIAPVVDNWPTLPVSESYFMRMLKAPGEFDLRDEPAPVKSAAWGDDDDDLFGDAAADEADATVAPTAGVTSAGGAWDDDDLEIDDSLLAAVVPEAAKSTSSGFVVPREGESIPKHWTENSQLAAAHVAAGSFITAVQLLQRQIGLRNAEPLQQLFIQQWMACNAAMSGISNLPPHMFALTTRPSIDDLKSKHAPALPKSVLASLKLRVRAGYDETTEGRLVDANRTFQTLMHQLLFVVVETKEEVAEIREMLNIAREYTAATAVEILRKENPGDAKRNVELAAYFTHFKLQPMHQILTLNSAMTQAFKIKNMKTAGIMARRLLDLDPPSDKADKARKVVQAADASGADAVKLDYDDRNPFTLCVVNKTPMYRGTVDPIRCAFCGSQAHPSTKGTICPVCNISALGVEGSGLVNKI